MLADADPALDLSLIIATRNRHDSLVRMLRAYRQIRTSVRWEMIIVDNGSIDGTAALLASEARRGRLPLLVIREEKPGLSRARNAGLRRAAGRLICFTDDDCYPDTAFLDAWMRVFATLPLDYAGGRVELFDPTDAATTIRTDLAPKPLLAGRFIAPGEVHGANLAFRREVVLALGPFLEAFGAGTSLYSAEDFEYCLRASARGFTGAYRPEPVVWHHHGRKSAAVPRIRYCYDVGRGALYAHLTLHNPGFLCSAVLAGWREQESLKAYLKTLYWIQRRRSCQTTLALLQGVLVYFAGLPGEYFRKLTGPPWPDRDVARHSTPVKNVPQ
jgi:GT2 family glycosyltransferase